MADKPVNRDALLAIVQHLDKMPRDKRLTALEHGIIVMTLLVALGVFDSDILAEPYGWHEVLSEELGIGIDNYVMLERMWERIDNTPAFFWAATWRTML